MGIVIGTGNEPWHASVGCVDWTKILYQASYKYIPFAVVMDTKSGGRRIHIHEYPSREWWDNEDMGRLRQTFDVQGYVFGDRFDEWAERLFAVCTDKEVGPLFLPSRVPVDAQCLTVDSTFQETALGRMEFVLRFTLKPGKPEGLVPSQNYTPTFLQNKVAIAADQLVTSSRKAFEEDFTGPQPYVSRRQSVGAIKDVALLMKRLRSQVRLDLESATKLEFGYRRVLSVADHLADIQRSLANVFSHTAMIYAQKPSLVPLKPKTSVTQGLHMIASTGQVLQAYGKVGEGFGGIVQDLFALVFEGALDYKDLVGALTPLMYYKISKLENARAPVGSAFSVQAELHLARTIAAYVRRLAIAYTGRAASLISADQQANLVPLRTKFINDLDSESVLAENHQAVYASLRELRSNTISFMNLYSAGGSLTQSFESRSPEPLAVVASNYYSGSSRVVDRDLEMMKINAVRHPLFPPAKLYLMKN
jgi:hypothetical protein